MTHPVLPTNFNTSQLDLDDEEAFTSAVTTRLQHKYLIYGHFPKTKLSYQGTLDTARTYLINDNNNNNKL